MNGGEKSKAEKLDAGLALIKDKLGVASERRRWWRRRRRRMKKRVTACVWSKEGLIWI